uniref:ZP domain-containing protein n=2 Tax=Panagrolaimus sp. PS1159 TaxID=55785 RepID=A0AC35G392_9BILA
MIRINLLLIFILVFDGSPLLTFASRLLDTSVSCDQDNFILSVNFDSTFRGIVYSEEGFPNCVYVNGSMLPQKSYTLKIPLDGCETRRNGEGNLENAIIVQDNVAFLQSTDKKYLLTCIPSSTVDERRDSMITVDFGGVTIDNRFTTTEIISATLPPNALMPTANLKYNVEIRAGHGIDAKPLTNPLNIGDPISYIVRLEKPVADSQIGRCWAKDDAKSNLELSDDRGCTVQPRGRIWTNFEKSETSNEVTFINKIKAWAFPSSNEVNIFCNLRVCMSRSCSFTNCSEPNDGKSRQRRHFDHPISDLAEVRTISMQLRFRRDDSRTASPSIPISTLETDIDSAVCLSLIHLALITACIFAFLILISLILLFIIPSKVSKNFRNYKFCC